MRVAKKLRRVVLAYSGSANTTVAIPWLIEHHGAEVVTVTLDLDQRTGLEATRDRALAAGAVRAHVVDARDEFARDFIVPALRAGAVTSEGDSFMAALTRPVIAKHLVAIARLEDAAAVAHGADDPDGEDARCFATLVRDLDPSLVVLTPASQWTFSDAERTSYARDRRLSIGAIDSHMAPRSASAPPDYPANLEVEFAEGMPIAVNGVSLPLVELISSVETIAGAHGVASMSPATTLLREAHRALQACVTPPHIDQSARERGADYADLVAAGSWYSAARAAGDAFAASVQKHVTGTACLKLFKGRSEVVECRSPFALSATHPLPTTDVVAARS